MNDVKELIGDLEKQKDITDSQIAKKKEEIGLLEREKGILKSQIKSVIDKEPENGEIYVDTVKEIILNLEKELETLADQKEKMIKAGEMNEKQLELTRKVSKISMDFPKKINPEFEYETKDEYWDILVELKKVNLFSEEEKFKGMRNQLDTVLKRNEEQVAEINKRIVEQKAKLDRTEGGQND